MAHLHFPEMSLIMLTKHIALKGCQKLIFCHYQTILVCDVYLIKLLSNNRKIVVAACPHEILTMPLFRFEYTAITKIMLDRATLVKFYSNYSLPLAGTVNLALAPFICSAQCFFDSLFQLKNISIKRSRQRLLHVFRKVAQLNIKYRKK